MIIKTMLRPVASAVGVCAVAAGAAMGAWAQSVVPLDAYARLPHVQSVTISPDGERLAMITGAERDEMYAIVTTLEGEGQLVLPAFSESIEDGLLFSVNWLSNDVVLITYRSRVTVPGGSQEDADLAKQIVYDIGDESYVELAGNASVVSRLPNEPDKVLVSANAEGRTASNSITRSRGASERALMVNLYEYDLERDDYRRVAQGTPQTLAWVLDDDFRPLLRQDVDGPGRTNRIFSYAGGGRPSMVYSESFTTERFGRRGRRAVSDIGTLAGRSYEGDAAWFSQLQNRDLNRGSKFIIETGEIEGGVIAPEGFDFGGFRTDWRTGRVIGASWWAERREVEWFDPEFVALQDQLDELFPLSDVNISNWDLSGNRVIIEVIGGDTSHDYYMLDRASGEMAFIATQYPEVPQERIHPVEIVRYQAEDGLDLWGYLTRPVDRDPENLPMIMLPHGGPQSRDTFGFDMWAQPLADMGYVVFQPQFRGSDGMGQGFVRRGHGEWGRRMQSDLTDAVNHFVDQGVADPDRVCIFGWSYGGYAALAGYALTPEVYRCAVAGAPVSDIMAMMQYEEDRMGGGSVNYWTEYIGDWRTQRDQMIAISPAQQVANADDPLLLIHGEEDLIVPVEQSEIMQRAAQGADKPVDFVRIPGDGHNLLFRRARLATIEAISDFLMEHNPPDPR